MKKIALSASVIVLFLLYSIGLRGGSSMPDSQTGANGQSNAPGPAQNSMAANPGTSTPTTTKYKDGTYTGSVADAFYGNIQVEATVQNGRLTAVKFLQYPNDRPNSIAINQQAMPYLQREAIQAQSAHVDGVSGATDTSIAFEESLSSALARAM